MKKAAVILLSIFLWIAAVLSLCVVVGVSSWFYLCSPVTSEEEAYSGKIKIPAGTSVRQVAQTLQDEKFIKSGIFLYLCARFNVFDRNSQFNLKSGTYSIKSSMSLREIYMLLQSGEQEYITVSIPEGLTKTKISQILEGSGVCSAQDFLLACKNQSLLDEFHVPGTSFEGYLFPDTYFFIPEMAGEEVLRTMVSNFFTKTSQIPSFIGLDPKTLHDTVILASVVEREYRIKEEAPLIASVFTNRLKHGIGLYSCATIEYIITEIQGLPHPERITYKDLKIDSPYNTYKWAGLPEGPISNPGVVALEASGAPAKTDYYFFVLTDPQKGKHTFSRTFDEHKAADNTDRVSK